MDIEEHNDIIFNNYPVNFNVKVNGFKPVKDGYVLTGIDTKDSSLWTGFCDQKHRLLWQQTFEIGDAYSGPHIAIAGNSYISIVRDRKTDSTTAFVAVSYTPDGNLQWAHKIITLHNRMLF